MVVAWRRPTGLGAIACPTPGIRRHAEEVVAVASEAATLEAEAAFEDVADSIRASDLQMTATIEGGRRDRRGVISADGPVAAADTIRDTSKSRVPVATGTGATAVGARPGGTRTPPARGTSS